MDFLMDFLMGILLSIIMIIIFIIVAVVCDDKNEKCSNTNVTKKSNIPYAGVAVALLEAGYKMHEAGAYDWISMNFIPIYQSRNFVGFQILVVTNDKPTSYDETFMNNFLLKNDMPGNWATSTTDNGDLCFMVEFEWSGETFKWKEFSNCVWDKIASQHPNWTIVTYPNGKFVYLH